MAKTDDGKLQTLTETPVGVKHHDSSMLYKVIAYKAGDSLDRPLTLGSSIFCDGNNEKKDCLACGYSPADTELIKDTNKAYGNSNSASIKRFISELESIHQAKTYSVMERLLKINEVAKRRALILFDKYTTDFDRIKMEFGKDNWDKQWIR
jgi:hypothetical protein